MKYLWLSLSLTLAHAQAETFTPYRFLGQPRHEVPSSFHVKNNVPSSLLTPIKMGDDVEITLFKNAIKPLDDFRLGLERFSDFTYSSCDEALQTPNQCSADTTELDALVGRICHPENFIQNQDLSRTYEAGQLNTLLGSIQVILSPLRDQNIPSTLLTHELIQMSRMILAKLDYANFTTTYQSATHLIKNLQRSCPNARLTAIQTEIGRIKDQVDASVALATIENQKRVAELKEQNRCRNELPHPELTDEDRIFLSTYVGGLSWRIRGGALWDIPTQTRRKHFAGKVFENLIVLTSNDRKLGKEYGEGAVQRLQIKGWSEWFDMGRTDDDDVSDMRGMTVRGLYQIGIGSYYGPFEGASPRKPFEKRGYDSSWLKVAGLQMGGCYMYASRFLEHHIVVEHLDSPLQHFMPPHHSAWAEACFGAVLGEAISRSLLQGRSCN